MVSAMDQKKDFPKKFGKKYSLLTMFTLVFLVSEPGVGTPPPPTHFITLRGDREGRGREGLRDLEIRSGFNPLSQIRYHNLRQTKIETKLVLNFQTKTKLFHLFIFN